MVLGGIVLTLAVGAAARQFRKWAAESEAQPRGNDQIVSYPGITTKVGRSLNDNRIYPESKQHSSCLFSIAIGNKEFRFLPKTDKMDYKPPRNDALVAEQLRQVKILLICIGVLLAGILYSWRSPAQPSPTLYIDGGILQPELPPSPAPQPLTLPASSWVWSLLGRIFVYLLTFSETGLVCGALGLRSMWREGQEGAVGFMLLWGFKAVIIKSMGLSWLWMASTVVVIIR